MSSFLHSWYTLEVMKSEISLDDFSKLDLVVGKVLAVDNAEGSDKLYRLTVDLGSQYGTRTIFAGMKKWHTKAKLKGKQFAFVANLASKRMPSGESQGMMLAICGTGDAPILVPVTKLAQPGASLC